MVEQKGNALALEQASSPKRLAEGGVGYYRVQMLYLQVRAPVGRHAAVRYCSHGRAFMTRTAGGHWTLQGRIMKLEQQIATDLREVLGSKDAARRVQGLLDAERQRVRRHASGCERRSRRGWGRRIALVCMVASAAWRGPARLSSWPCLQVHTLQEEVESLKRSVAEVNADEARSAVHQLQRENAEQQRRIKDLTAQKVCQVQGELVPVLGPRNWG
jgi:hypothetical protein